MAKLDNTPKESSILNQFKNLFNIGISQNSKNDQMKIYPTIPVMDKKNKDNILFKKEVFPENVKQIFKWWMTSCHDGNMSWSDRKQLWKDMQMLFLNCPYVARSAKLIADETVQVGNSSKQCIQVEAKRKVKKFILDLFDKTKLYSKIRPTALDYAKYGNCLWILGLDESGVSDIVLADIMSFDDRLEFTPYRVKREIEKQNNRDNFFTKYRCKVKRIDQLIKAIQNKEKIASYYKSYLFGFQVGDNVLPPWRALHFRNYCSEEPFYPFGIPMFINSVAPYRQYDAGMTLQAVARGLRFPKDVYKLIIPNVSSPTEKFAQAAELSNLIQNSGINGIRKEQNGLGETIITIDGLYTWDQEVPNIDLGRTDDLEMLRDDVIISTDMPRNLIDPNDSAFGDSGISLVEKWKPFARLIYGVQSVTLEQVTQLVKIHMIQSREFKPDEVEFMLSMPYPESLTNEELITNQNELLDLANGLIDAMSEKFNNGEPLPDELMQLIYNKFLPYDSTVMDEWFKILKKQNNNEPYDNNNGEPDQKDKEEPPSDEEPSENKENLKGSSIKDLEKSIYLMEKYIKLQERFKSIGRMNWKLIESKLKNVDTTKISLKEQVEDSITKYKIDNLREFKSKRRHFYSSKNLSDDFNPFDLIKYDKEILNEQFEDKDKIKNEILKGAETLKYKFKFKKKKIKEKT